MKTAIFWMFWIGFSSVAFLLALAVNDFSQDEAQREAERLEAVHTQGMALGSSLCGGRP